MKEKTVLETYEKKNLEALPMELDILAKVYKKGVNIMCEIADRIREEGREE